MKNKFIVLIIFLNSLFFTFSIVQNWNFENSSKDLLSPSGYVSVRVIEETTDNLYVKLFKYIGKESGSIVYKNYFTFKYYSETVYNDKLVPFDKIGSYHHFENDNIICPKGKYHPYYFYNDKYSP